MAKSMMCFFGFTLFSSTFLGIYTYTNLRISFMYVYIPGAVLKIFQIDGAKILCPFCSKFLSLQKSLQSYPISYRNFAPSPKESYNFFKDLAPLFVV